MRVIAQGFKTFEDKSLHLEVAKSAELNVPLVIGATAESIEVDANVSPLVTESVAQGTVISQQEVRALPLNGRQFLQLALLSPGTNSGGPRGTAELAAARAKSRDSPSQASAPTIPPICSTASSTPTPTTTLSPMCP
ncbi:MAG: hypothetical protein WDO73_03495 [Ignavibacteriota bacterium]